MCEGGYVCECVCEQGMSVREGSCLGGMVVCVVAGVHVCVCGVSV